MSTQKQKILSKEQELQEKYINNPNACPFCGSDSISGEAGEFDNNIAYRDVTCTACGRTWTEGFVLDQVTFDVEDIIAEL